MSWSLILMLTPIGILLLIWVILEIWSVLEKKKLYKKLFGDNNENDPSNNS